MAYLKCDCFTIYAYIGPDGRRYIGNSGSQRAERAGNGGSGYKHCSCFWKAIQRFGWDSFKYEILATVPKSQTNAAQLACDLEARYIREYQTTNIRFGFNRFKSDSPRSYAKLSESRRNRRVVNKDGVIKHVPESQFDTYIQKGWNPGYKQIT